MRLLVQNRIGAELQVLVNEVDAHENDTVDFSGLLDTATSWAILVESWLLRRSMRVFAKPKLMVIMADKLSQVLINEVDDHGNDAVDFWGFLDTVTP